MQRASGGSGGRESSCPAPFRDTAVLVGAGTVLGMGGQSASLSRFPGLRISGHLIGCLHLPQRLPTWSSYG